ncbi:MAG: hypothetical protein ACK4GL_06730 [Flavobacteriales bacterium]
MKPKYIFIILITIATLPAIAQPGSPVINIFKPYEPKVIDAKKILEVPSVEDSIKTDMTISYEINSRMIATSYEIDPIKAAKMKQEKLTKLYRGFLKAGFGNYSTPYLEAFYNSTRHRKYNGGVHFKHLSSTGQLNNTGFTGFSENMLNLNGKSFINKQTLSGNIGFKRDVVHFYGFNPEAPEFVGMALGREDIRQRYNLFNLKLGINDHYPVDSATNKYKGGLHYYNYSDADNHVENFIGLNGKADFYIKKFKLDAGLKFENYNNTIGDQQINHTIIGFRPGIGLGESKWKLRLGLAAMTGFDTVSRGFIAPEVDFRLHIYEDILVFFAGTESKLERNSFRQLSSENPFIRPDSDMRSTVMPFRLFAGMRGVASSKTSYKAAIAYTEMENVPFYVNETMVVNFPDDQGNLIPTVFNSNRMDVVYDNASLLHFNAEVAHQRTDKLNIAFGVDYLKYTPDVELKAWHTPTLRWKMTGRYNLEDKITVKASVFNLNRQFAREFRRDTSGANVITSRQLRGITDLNLGVEYRYTKVMHLFLNVNNMLGVRYQRYLGYPTQRFNLLGGLTYSF